MNVANGVLTLSCLALCALVSTVHGQTTDSVFPKPEYIVFQPDGRTCKIRDVAVDCDSALRHLRDVLKLPPGSEVRFKAGRSVPYPVIKRTMDEVQHSEYVTAVAFVLPPKSERKP
jgi:hypothetical protein